MKRIARVLIVALFAIAAMPAVFAQTNASKGYHREKPAGTNLTLSGFLTVRYGIRSLQSGSYVIDFVEPPTNTNGERVASYSLICPDSTRVSFGSEVADTAPVKLGDYLNESVTITGLGREMSARGGKRISIEKITGITKNPVAAQPIVTVSGTVTMWRGIVPGLTRPRSPASSEAGTNAITGANTNEVQLTYYYLTGPDGIKKATFASSAVDSAPVKLGDCLNESVTMVGLGREMSVKSAKWIEFDKITSLTRNAAASQSGATTR